MSRFLGLRGNGLNIAAILGVLMPGIMVVGYNSTVLGGVLSLDSFEKQFPEINVEIADTQSYASGLQGVAVAAFTIGGFLGTLSCIWLGDWLGRRRLMMVGSVIQVTGTILATSACSLAQLIGGRIIIGFGVGEIWATVPLWLSEISPIQKRGSHVATKGVFSSLGCATALFLDYGMSFTHESIAWRLPFGFPVFFSIVILGFLAFLPESPRWLIRQGRVSEAREILAALENTTIEDNLIEARILEVQTSLALSGKGKPLKQMFCMGPQRTFHRALLAVGVLILGHLTGATVTTFYTTAIFENNLLLGESTSRLLAAVYQLVGPIGGIVCVLTIESFGRRKLMLASAVGNATCLVLLASLGSMPGNPWATHAAVFFLFLFHFTYIIGFGGIPYLYTTEIAPLHIRTTVISLSMSISWMFGVVITSVTPIAFNSMGQRFFFIFAALNMAMVPAIYYLFPETSGRSLEEMDEIFALSESTFEAVKVAKRLPRRHCKNSTLREAMVEIAITTKKV
ncbi:hypothetical protein N7474_011141 [Penicillium riverlandense]|uniref:uncharacterized protein n=1 Tax=Penicillium riverlandense TaxID=1903569 RepID=UPI002546E400|nr:uncharacterized protein N7474_011141 [Penicillium riverlandense]KAJ5805254.1 hypothetical protein N7474_011141 [Penicillium riverlandense]